MPNYHRVGEIPSKRHTQFRSNTGSLYHEQLFGTEGFHGTSSLLYHLNAPTQIVEIKQPRECQPKAAVLTNIHPRKFLTQDIANKGDFVASRVPLLFNNTLQLGVATPDVSSKRFYKNAGADELLFIHEGEGVLVSLFGRIPFRAGDYLVIPKGTIYQMVFASSGNRYLFLESASPIVTPKRYRNEFGQLLEHAPFCERDLRRPEYTTPISEAGAFDIHIKKQGHLHVVTYRTHPFDVVGWDGYNYPYALSIHDFEPITGRIHQPPPVHQTFQGRDFVVCSFCPRLYDYHPQAIPAPYNHSNIDSDEVLYYVDGDFMSRNDIGPGVMTLHPGGIPHGPHPGAVERSIGKKSTNELAVMIDPFQPFHLTEAAMKYDDGSYYSSWINH